jgi:cytidine deaminase
MDKKKFEFAYEVYDDSSKLNEQDAWLLNEARQVTQQAYALIPIFT